MSNNTIRLICPNSKCINKSIVYRRFDALKEQTCKACGTLLSIKNTAGVRTKQQDELAKKQLGL